jgi:type I restriction enzyme, S subunit
VTVWKSKRLGELCTIELGKTPSRSTAAFWDVDRSSGNVWLSIADLLNVNENFVDDSKEYISDKGATLCKRVRKGTLLVSFKLTLGRLAFAARDLYTNEAIAALTIHDENELGRKYLFYFLHFFDWIKAAENDVKLKGMTLNKAKLKELKVYFPPLPEQQRIVALLDEAFAGLAVAAANAEKNLKNAREVFESYLNSVFDQRGEGWSVERLGDLSEVKDGTHDSPKYVANGIPFVTQKNIRSDGLSLDNVRYISEKDHNDFYRRSNVELGDIIISMIGANRGMSCLVDDPQTFSIKNVGLIKSSWNINQNYVLYFLKSQFAADYVKTASRGGAQEFIGLTKLRDFPVLVAPFERQALIVKSLDQLSVISQQLETVYSQKLTAIAKLKQALLQKAFAGELTKDFPAPVTAPKTSARVEA